MFKNYLKTALRNARRSPGNSLINILGLAVGVGCCILIGLYVWDEISYDRFHKDSDRLYRLEQTVSDGTLRWEIANVDHGPVIKGQISQVEETGRLFVRGYLATAGETRLNNISVAFADPSILTMFSFMSIVGEIESMLDEPGDIVLRASLASRLFGDENPLGQEVLLDNEHVFTVAGVVDLPHSSVLDNFEAMVPFEQVYDHYSWLRNNPHASTTFTYVKLHENTDLEDALVGLPGVSQTIRGDASYETLHLEPVTRLRLDPQITNATGTRGTVNLLTAIALMVLLIACVNYVNLATATGVARLREVGMRKTFGAYRKQLIAQFIGESTLQVVVSVVIGLMFVEAAIPYINDLTGKALSLGVLENSTGISALLILCLVVGLAAGAYPALYLTRFSPVQILKGGGDSSKGTPVLRRALIVVQFAASIVLISGALVIREQLTFLGSADLGFSEDQVLTIRVDTDDEAAIRALEGSLEGLAAVSSVSRYSGNIGRHEWMAGMTQVDSADDIQSLSHMFFPADSEFLSTMQIELVAGRGFSPDVDPAVSEELIVNEASVRALGFQNPSDIVGKQYSVNYIRAGEVVGVVHDFHLNSLKDDIGPLVFANQSEGMYMMAIKLQSASVFETIEAIEAAWKTHIPDWPFAFQFVDDAFDALYRAERREGTLFTWFAGLAVLVACMGLFGLVSLAARQRTREVGIRKVLGASVGSILTLLGRSFVTQVALAFTLAAPLTFLFMSKWLEGFAYHIEFPVASLAVGGGVTLLMTMVVVGLRSVRAAMADPIEALRYE